MTVKHAHKPVRHSRLRTIVAASTMLTLAGAGVFAGAMPAHARYPHDVPGITLYGTGGIEGMPHGYGFYAFEGPADHGGDSILTWCLHLWRPHPTKDTPYVGVDNLATSSMWGPDELDLTTPQMAWLLDRFDKKWKASGVSPEEVDAHAFLVHANFEQPDPESGHPDTQATVDQMVNAVKTNARPIYDNAVRLVTEARNSAAVGYTNSEVPTENVRHGVIKNLAVLNAANKPVAGIDMKLVIEGPAVFDETGTKEWTGKTKAEPFTLTWTATGNGDVKTRKYGRLNQKELTRFLYGPGTQNMLNKPKGDPEWSEGPARTFHVIYDFQPKAVSNVAKGKIADDGKTITDTLTVSADPSYGDGKWLNSDAGPIPVTFEGTAYYTGERPAAESPTVPEGAREVGKTSITATGPGEYTATITKPEGIDSSFITWVWKVVKANQKVPVTSGGAAFTSGDFVHADWADNYGLADETSVERWPVEIDSSINVHKTKSGNYLSDDLFVMGMPSDHPDFAGGAGFKPDTAVFKQSLLFFPDGLEVTEATKAKAEVIATVDVPAKNGFYSHVGATSFKVKDGQPGTYVFVTSFAGDDRVKPFTSSVEDVTEQYVVPPEPPTLHTTATDKADGDKTLDTSGEVTITDRVCYTGLKPGKEYTLTGTLMDKATEKPITGEDGEALTSTVTHTPTKAEDCTDVEFTVDASLLLGKKTVVFERVEQDQRTIAVHTDINDEGQTVETPPVELGTTATDKADGDKFFDPEETVTLTDKACYTNLTVGKEYTLTGTLMDKATEKPITGEDGKPLTGSTRFIPTVKDGCANVDFTVAGSLLRGKTVVVFESLTHEGREIAIHADINDEGQTVREEPTLPPTGAAVVGASILALIAGGAGTILLHQRRRAAA